MAPRSGQGHGMLEVEDAVVPRSIFAEMTLEEVLEDLSSRFIVNLPAEELSSIERICFQIEQAHWFYTDFVLPHAPHLPHLSSLRSFYFSVLSACPLLCPETPAPQSSNQTKGKGKGKQHPNPSGSRSNVLAMGWTREELDGAYDNFLRYKERVPVCGAIILAAPPLSGEEAEMEGGRELAARVARSAAKGKGKVLLVKGWKKGSTWSFPRGKINQEEPDLDCAIREVWEETGYDLCPHYGRPPLVVPHQATSTPSPTSSPSPDPPGGHVRSRSKSKFIEVSRADPDEFIELTIKEQRMRLYVVLGVREDENFVTQTRKEISRIEWVPLTELPGWRKGTQPDEDRAFKTFMVTPFVPQLKSLLTKHRAKYKASLRHQGQMDQHLSAPLTYHQDPLSDIDPNDLSYTDPPLPQQNPHVYYESEGEGGHGAIGVAPGSEIRSDSAFKDIDEANEALQAFLGLGTAATNPIVENNQPTPQTGVEMVAQNANEPSHAGPRPITLFDIFNCAGPPASASNQSLAAGPSNPDQVQPRVDTTSSSQHPERQNALLSILRGTGPDKVRSNQNPALDQRDHAKDLLRLLSSGVTSQATPIPASEPDRHSGTITSDQASAGATPNRPDQANRLLQLLSGGPASSSSAAAVPQTAPVTTMAQPVDVGTNEEAEREKEREKKRRALLRALLALPSMASGTQDLAISSSSTAGAQDVPVPAHSLPAGLARLFGSDTAEKAGPTARVPEPPVKHDVDRYQQRESLLHALSSPSSSTSSAGPAVRPPQAPQPPAMPHPNANALMSILNGGKPSATSPSSLTSAPAAEERPPAGQQSQILYNSGSRTANTTQQQHQNLLSILSSPNPTSSQQPVPPPLPPAGQLSPAGSAVTSPGRLGFTKVGANGDTGKFRFPPAPAPKPFPASGPQGPQQQQQLNSQRPGSSFMPPPPPIQPDGRVHPGYQPQHHQQPSGHPPPSQFLPFHQPPNSGGFGMHYPPPPQPPPSFSGPPQFQVQYPGNGNSTSPMSPIKPIPVRAAPQSAFHPPPGPPPPQQFQQAQPFMNLHQPRPQRPFVGPMDSPSLDAAGLNLPGVDGTRQAVSASRQTQQLLSLLNAGGTAMTA